jgi:iron(III) transport system substrate-binding protein
LVLSPAIVTPCGVNYGLPASSNRSGVAMMFDPHPIRRSAAKPGSQLLTAHGVALVLLWSGLHPALTETRSLAEIATYQGTDRTARLVAGARQEGTVSVYGSSVTDDMNPVIDAFKKAYNIDVRYWRASSESLVQRALSEQRAGRCLVDTFSTVAGELEALYREQVLIPIKSPLTAELIPQALRPHGAWVATRLNIFSGAYNTNLVKPNEVPRSYQDLKDPRWKGRLTIEADDVDWFATLVTKMGREQGLNLFAEIARTNGLSIRKGHTLLANLVAAGEVPLALTVYNYKPEQLRRTGAPIAPLYLSPLIALGYGPAVAACAPHPNAAILFYDFIVGDAQAIWAKRDMATTNPKVMALPQGADLTLIDPAEMLDRKPQWDELWNRIVLRPQ